MSFSKNSHFAPLCVLAIGVSFGPAYAEGVASAPASKTAATITKNVKVTGAAAVNATPGDRQYPTGSPAIPPKPKKDGLEIAGSVKGTAATVAAPGNSQYPTGSPAIPPKPKKEGLEAAGAIKAKAAQP